MKALSLVFIAILLVMPACSCRLGEKPLPRLGYHVYAGKSNKRMLASPETTNICILPGNKENAEYDHDAAGARRVGGYISDFLSAKEYRVVEREEDADFVVYFHWRPAKMPNNGIASGEICISACNKNEDEVWGGYIIGGKRMLPDPFLELKDLVEELLRHWGKGSLYYR